MGAAEKKFGSLQTSERKKAPRIRIISASRELLLIYQRSFVGAA